MSIPQSRDYNFSSLQNIFKNQDLNKENEKKNFKSKLTNEIAKTQLKPEKENPQIPKKLTIKQTNKVLTKEKEIAHPVVDPNQILLACENGNLDIVKQLIQKGANVNVTNADKETPLLLACRLGFTDMAKLLIQKGGDVNAANSEQWTPLLWACYKGNTEIVKLLIQKGANVNVADADKRTPLIWACSLGFTEMAKLLIQNKADLNVADVDKEKTPLHWACSKGNAELATLLIQKGAHVNVKDVEQTTPLHWACFKGNQEIVKLLIERGADLDSENNRQATPLHWAAGKGNSEIVKLLLEKGADNQIWDDDETRPIHRALELNQLETASILLKYEKHPILPLFSIDQLHFAQYFGIAETFTLQDQVHQRLGSFFESIHPLLLDDLEKFIKIENKELPQGFDWNRVLSTYSNPVRDYETFLKALKDPSIQMIMIPTGWLKHETGIILIKPYEPGKPFFIMRSNRGNRTQGDAGSVISQVEKKDNIEEAFSKMNRSLKTSMEYFETGIDKDLGLKQVQVMKHKDQTIDNCPLASGKLNLQGVIYGELLRNHYSHDKAKILSRKLYKSYTNFGRKQQVLKFIASVKSLEDYFREHHISKEELQNERISYKEVLEKAIFKCAHEGRLESFQLLLKTFPELAQVKNQDGLTPLQVEIRKSS